MKHQGRGMFLVFSLLRKKINTKSQIYELREVYGEKETIMYTKFPVDVMVPCDMDDDRNDTPPVIFPRELRANTANYKQTVVGS